MGLYFVVTILCIFRIDLCASVYNDCPPPPPSQTSMCSPGKDRVRRGVGYNNNFVSIGTARKLLRNCNILLHMKIVSLYTNICLPNFFFTTLQFICRWSSRRFTRWFTQVPHRYEEHCSAGEDIPSLYGEGVWIS
jgi:hypothetical protein